MPFIPAWFDDMELTTRQFRIAVHIARRGDCYESARSIAAHCMISRNTVLKEIKNLAEMGLICERLNTNGRPFFRLEQPGITGTGLSQNGTGLSHPNKDVSGTGLSHGGSIECTSGTRLSQNGSIQIPKGTTPKKVPLLRNSVPREKTPKKATSKKPSKSPWEEVCELDWPKGFRERKDFVQILKDWVEFRVGLKKLRQSPSQFFGRQLAQMEGWGVDGAIQSLAASLAGEWQGVFAPRETGKQQSTSTKSKSIDELTGADFTA